jgi:hypothetical protein
VFDARLANSEQRLPQGEERRRLPPPLSCASPAGRLAVNRATADTEAAPEILFRRADHGHSLSCNRLIVFAMGSVPRDRNNSTLCVVALLAAVGAALAYYELAAVGDALHTRGPSQSIREIQGATATDPPQASPSGAETTLNDPAAPCDRCATPQPQPPCTGWGCLVDSGAFVDGPPFFRLRHVCIASNSVTFYPSSAEHESELRELLRSCCGISDLANRSSATVQAGAEAACLGAGAPQPFLLLCAHNLNVYDSILHLARWNELAPSPFLPGESLFLDTAITGWHQFKHTTGRLVQYSVLGRTFDHILMPRVDHLPADGPLGSREGTTARAMFNATVLPHIIAGFTELHMSGPHAPPLCAEAVYSIPDYEKMHFSTTQGERWRRVLSDHFGVVDAPCPPARVALLKRMPGDGALRGFANEGVIDEIAAEFGISHVDRISIGSKNTTAEHVALFNSIGLLITGHSSQLTNLIFASRNTAVVEIVGAFLPWWMESPFQVGMSNIQLHYNLSRYHAADIDGCGKDCLLLGKVNDKNAILTIDAERLRASMQDVITKQRTACPQLPWVPLRSRGS